MTTVRSYAFYVLALLLAADDASAQVAPITSSGLGTQVSGPIVGPGGTTQFNITGGMRPGNGPNLFQSFGNFSVPTNNIANFLNDAALPTTNILGRVTGGNVSSIFGTIQTTNFGNANLFLMNPAGFLFGPTATLNVGGMVTFTSADYLRFADNARFNASPHMDAGTLLSTAPVAAFGFLGTNPGAITVQGSQLMVTPGQTISLVGGDITVEGATIAPNNIQSARLTAPGGQINLASVASPGEIPVSNFQIAPTMTGGAITLAQGSLLDVSANAAGTVRIRGGELVMDNATISADTVNANGAPTAVDIQLTGDLSITAELKPAITARTSGTGDAGEIRIVSENMSITGINEDVLSVIDSQTSGSGKGGNVNITTGNLEMVGDPVGIVWSINSGTTNEGRGGDVTIAAKNITMEDTYIVTGDANFDGASGSSGNISISTDSLQMVFSSIETTTTEGGSGAISLAAESIQLETSSISATSAESQGGAITITGDRVVLADESSIESITGDLQGGDITVNGKVVEVNGGSTIFSNTIGDGDAGTIRISAKDRVSLIGTSGTAANGIFTVSGVAGVVTGLLGGSGQAGDVVIVTPKLEMTGGSMINTATLTSGRGGDVTIQAGTLSMSGQLLRPNQAAISAGGNQVAGGIFTSTVGTNLCSGLCGDAGGVSITTGTLSLTDGSRINSGTSSTGRGGEIAISAQDSISLSGRLRDGSPVAIISTSVGTAPNSGAGGDISLTAGQSFTLTNGASVAASSTGPGNAGNITINAGGTFTSTNSSVTTQATQASGGNITVLATDMVQLTNSQLNASVQGSETTVGGNIVIDPQSVILQNSQIVATATQGQGGNISITTQSFLADATSVIDASSQFGINGTVNIQSPTAQMAGRLVALPANPLILTSLFSQRCAALTGGQFSSFIVAGRYGMPPEPGGWLASPFVSDGPGAAISAQEGAPSFTGDIMGSRSEPDTFSIRRWPDSGTTALNALPDWTAGCGS
ncbi:MAG: filamentous hemagglutinin N-terminal domain-containing protein [Nitrospiraceae bacterium]